MGKIPFDRALNLREKLLLQKIFYVLFCKRKTIKECDKNNKLSFNYCLQGKCMFLWLWYLLSDMLTMS